jgi:hypothetical protein
MKIDNIKGEVLHDMENLRKKNETEKQNKIKGQSSRLELVEDRITELEEKMEIKVKTVKTEELLVKQHKISERNMQELTDYIKTPNLRITGIEKGKKY